MRIAQCLRDADGRWHTDDLPPDFRPRLAFVFASTRVPDDAWLGELPAKAHGACVVGASTAGEIHGSSVADGTVSMTLVELAHTDVHTAVVADAREDSAAEGRALIGGLPAAGLRHVLVFFEGLHVNGSQLVAGMREVLPPHVGVTGGLAGDSNRFASTFVLHGERPRRVRGVAIGLYGERVRVRSASLGGWDPFGPERVVTRSDANVLHELDGRPALELYRAYLADYAEKLPASALLFPLRVRTPDSPHGLVRTILSCNDEDGSMTFAGDVPEGCSAQLMRANMDRLVQGAEDAASAALGDEAWRPELALLVSCVGRKLVLRQHVDDEVAAVQRVFGPDAKYAGFYSYGEISPFTPDARCELHNQTMTVTALAEL